MIISLRFKLFAAFALMAGAMTALLVLSSTAMDRQAGVTVATLQRLDALADPMARLQALPHQARALVLAHLQSREPGVKTAIEAELLALDTAEALALSTLARLAQGAEGALVSDLAQMAGQAGDLRERLLAISGRNVAGQAVTLATQEMPVLRAQVTEALRNVAAQSGDAVAAARAEAAMNAMAAAQKNALLQPEPGFVTGQLAAAALAGADLAAALGILSAQEVPGLPPLQALVHDLQALNVQLDQLLRDTGAERAMTILDTQLRPLDLARQDQLAALGQLMQTSRRAIQDATLASAADWRLVLVILADIALILGFGLVVMALARLGSGLEGAVRLAEQMAGQEAVSPTWIRGNLSGRLTAALVRISGGQSAVLASLEAMAAGRPPRHDLPDKLRQRFAALVQSLGSRQTEDREVSGLQGALRDALQDAQVLQEGTGRLARALETAGTCQGLTSEAERQALVAERHLATLIVAERQANGLKEGFADRPAPQRRLA